MKIKSYKKVKNGLYEVVLSNNKKIVLHEDLILKENLLLKKEIDELRIEELTKMNEKYELYNKAIKYLSSKMRTKNEIKSKFKDYSIEAIDFVIQKLYKDGYLNDKVYVKAYINDQINLKLVGPNKIIGDLKKLGFKEELFLDEINEVDSEIWQEKIKKLISKAIKTNRNKSNAYLARKITNDLINKGFNSNMVAELICDTEFGDDSEIIRKQIAIYYKKYQLKYDDDELKYFIINKLLSKGYNKSKAVEIYENYIN